MSVAFVFPGQGSQAPGMGLDWAEPAGGATDVYGWASACLEQDLVATLRDADVDALRRTETAQPAIFAVSVAAFQALQRAGVRPDVVAGHSLGELGALVAAGVLSFEAGLTLVTRRAQVMQRAADTTPGGMSSVLGLSREAVELAVEKAAGGNMLVVANDNAPGNVVVSGELPALERLPEAARELGAKRVVRLNVGGAFHSPLLQDAETEFRRFMSVAPMRDPSVPVVANASAEPHTSAPAVRELVSRQLTGPVRWVESVRRMVDLGVDTFVEVGPGTVLGGLIRRIAKGTRVLSAADQAGVDAVAEALREQSETFGSDAEQGEIVVLPERFAVSPGHGRFYPSASLRTNDQGSYVEKGDLIGEVRSGNGGAALPVRSGFRARVLAQLVWEGDMVTPGQVLLSLRPF